MTDLFDRYRVIDVDTHLTEPPDVWTAHSGSEVPARLWGAHIERRDAPGPATPSLPPREYAADALGALPEATLAKVLHDNAARVYHLH